MPEGLSLIQKIEAILFYKNEPVTYKELAKSLEVGSDKVRDALKNMQNLYEDRGFILVDDGSSVSLGTHPKASSLVENIQRDELSREIGRAGLETLAIVLYKGPVSRREIDYIRGVNSSYILRNLLIRGLIERDGGREEGRGFVYKPTLELLRHLGISRVEDLPEYNEALAKVNTFISEQKEDNLSEDAH